MVRNEWRPAGCAENDKYVIGADGYFLRKLPALLNPEHGVVMVNVHRGDLPPIWKQLQLKLLGERWMDPLVMPVAKAYR